MVDLDLSRETGVLEDSFVAASMSLLIMSLYVSPFLPKFLNCSRTSVSILIVVKAAILGSMCEV
jgi:hypothetical protein